MRLIIRPDYDDCSQWAANYIAYKINGFRPTPQKPFVLGLPTGSTPLGTYRELIKLNQAGKLSFENVVTFNMDEYIGLDARHPQSYHYFMWENFFKHIDIKRENVHILNGMTKNYAKECQKYEDAIKKAGGIHLFLGGVGSDGHIAFNEPGSSLTSRTRVKTLTSETIKANSRFFDNRYQQSSDHGPDCRRRNNYGCAGGYDSFYRSQQSPGAAPCSRRKRQSHVDGQYSANAPTRHHRMRRRSNQGIKSRYGKLFQRH